MTRPKRQPTSRDDRIRIQTLYDAGMGRTAIVQHLNQHREETHKISVAQVKYALSHRLTPQKSTGRPRDLTEDDVDYIELFLIENRWARWLTFEHLAPCLSQQISLITPDQIRVALSGRGYQRRVTQQKPPLSEANRQARLAFALAHAEWTVEQWMMILWSDESWVMSRRHRTQYVICKNDELPENDCIRKKGWMFWGSFHGSTKGLAVYWETAWGTITAESYMENILTRVADYMLQPGHEGLTFVQDNAQHSSDYLESRALTPRLVRWPAQSPDLNVIEDIWCWMKDWIENRTGVDSNLHVSKKRLRRLVVAAWEAVPPGLLEELVSTMPTRIKAVIAANGGQINI